MEKVKLSSEVAEAIETMRKEGVTNVDIIRDHFSDGRWARFDSLNHFDPDTLICALYIGYEVEQTKEDKVREVIRSFCNGAIVSDWVIEDIKKIYEGVNDQ